MNLKKIIPIIILIILLFNIAFAVEKNASFEHSDVCINFFYGEGCPHCKNVKPVLDEIEEKYPDVDIHRYEIYHNQKNALLLYDYYETYNVPKNQQGGVPILFVGDNYYIGDSPIIDNIEKEITKIQEGQCSTNVTNSTGVVGDSSPIEEDQNKSFSLITVIGAALVDSINPCAIAVLLILLAGLFMIGKPKKAFQSGIAFMVAIYIMYFIIGIGLFSLVNFATGFWSIAGSVMKYLVASFAIILGLLNLKDFFWYGGGGFVMEIPRTWRPTMKKLIRNVTSPWSAFIVGLAVSAFEMPCTGGPYLFVMSYLADKVTMAKIIPILALYNLVFILPLIVILLAIYFGLTSVEKASKWREKNIRKLHLIEGLIMVGLGIFVLLV